MKTSTRNPMPYEAFLHSTRGQKIMEVQEILKQPESVNVQDIFKIRSFIIGMIDALPHESAPHLATIKAAITLFYSPRITVLRGNMSITDKIGSQTFAEFADRRNKRVIAALFKKAHPRDTDTSHRPHLIVNSPQ